MRFVISHNVTDKQIEDTLVNALDHGSLYWIQDIETPNGALSSFPTRAIPLPLYVTDEDGVRHTVDHKAIHRGLVQMARQCPRVFAIEFPREDKDYDGDGSSADCFLQMCVFGKLIYG